MTLWKKDKFSTFKEVFEMFNKLSAQKYSIDDFLAIDETLYPTRGSNKEKLAKLGLNFRNLGSA